MDTEEILPGFDKKYRIIERIGKGGFAEVYRARDLNLDRDVAIKLLSRRHNEDEETLLRFSREAKLYASLDHKNLIPIHDTGVIGDRAYMVMKYIDGHNLDTLLDRHGTLPTGMVRQLLTALCEVLAYLHDRGIVHRDIKPANIIIEKESRTLYLADFGIAHAPAAEAITETGIIMGTPFYLSPELAKGKPVDHRSDIYALGAMFYHLVTGEPVFNGDSAIDILMKHAGTPPTPIAQAAPDTDAGIAFILDKCLEKEPASRFQSVTEITDTLKTETTGSPLAAYSTPPVGVGHKKSMGKLTVILLILLAAIGVFFMVRSMATHPEPGSHSSDLSHETTEEPGQLQTKTPPPPNTQNPEDSNNPENTTPHKPSDSNETPVTDNTVDKSPEPQKSSDDTATPANKTEGRRKWRTLKNGRRRRFIPKTRKKGGRRRGGSR